MRNLCNLVDKRHDFGLKDFCVISEMSDVAKAENGI